MPQPTYSRDLALVDFFLFTKLKMLTTLNDDTNLLKKVITGDDVETNAQLSHLATIDEIKEKLKQELLAILDTKGVSEIL